MKSWMSFAVDKLSEIVVVAKAINDGPAAVKAELDANKKWCVSLPVPFYALEFLD